MTVIPGSTEYGYDPHLVATDGEGEPYAARNRHTTIAVTDWQASIDELQAVCPNLEQVALVISWFGTDLRAGNCDVLPGVTDKFFSGWKVGDYNRNTAHLVSRIDGKPAFGGTPDDGSILRAIADLKARGLRVVLYPFMMMDIPDDTILPDLSGAGTQPPYPWRGEISCYPAPDAPNTVDKTVDAGTQITSFAARYSDFIDHYIDLAQQAGGVDGFLIGSEMRGLTRVRDENQEFPFVDALITIAANVKQALGSTCFVTYAADWSEYFGYQPADNSGDVWYNLDPLWASSSIDAIGIDNYMPLSDLREGRDPSTGEYRSSNDRDYLQSNIASGEGFDWYYASANDRQNALRSPITDGQGEPWIYRYKDLTSWWSNPHHERPAGIRSAISTNWQPQSKPIFFTELGCPAIDHGANQPNVFYDPKSSQSFFPYFSAGARDDQIQRRFLEAHMAFWGNANTNPQSSVYSGRMVAKDQITPWSWDARPFPAFPLEKDIWSDGPNWERGHWLNGRLGSAPVQDLVETILSEYGYDDVGVSIDGVLDGFVIPVAASARQVLEPLLSLFSATIAESQGVLQISQNAYAPLSEIVDAELVQEEDIARISRTRGSELELPAEAHFSRLRV